MKYEELAATHETYTEYLPKWAKCRDFIAGIDALRRHDLGKWRTSLPTVSMQDGKMTRGRVDGPIFEPLVMASYIPPLSNRMTFAEYVVYLARGHYYNIVEVTKSGYLGQLFGHPATFSVPASALADDIDLEGTPALEHFERLADEVVSVGRVGVLVDRHQGDTRRSRAEAERAGLRPFVAVYKAEDILDWKKGYIANRYETVYVKLREKVQRGKDSDYDFRELFLDANGYRQMFWTREKVGDEYSGKEIVPVTGQDKRIASIPFYPYSPRGGGIDIEPPPLWSLIDMAHEHYQASVEYASARFSAAVPTPGFYGFSQDEIGDVVLGGMNAFYSSNPEAHADYLQTGADGLAPLREALKDIEDRAAKMGSRALTSEKAAAEAAQTVRIRKSGESVTLADMANSISRIGAQQLEFMCVWMGQAGAVKFQLPTEYDDWILSSADFQTIYKAYQSGDYTRTDWLRLLRKRRFLDSDRPDAIVLAELEQAKAEHEESAAAALAATAKADRAGGAV